MARFAGCGIPSVCNDNNALKTVCPEINDRNKLKSLGDVSDVFGEFKSLKVKKIKLK